MTTFTVNLHLYDDEIKLTEYEAPNPFVAVNIGDFSLLARPGRADALRKLAAVAIEAAEVLDRLTEEAGGGA